MSTLFRIVNNLRFFRPHDANIAYFTMCCEHSRQFRATFKYNVQAMPMGAERRKDNDEFVLYTGSDTMALVQSDGNVFAF
jgi:hypothetical protein